ncbi:related to hexose transporter protein [Fusarium oxysporum]|uniref:Related to hexose transporter protein n=1 Tax=Fusarium oxysporum TaxID=5507 RepID=A0A2H3TVJ7_FUSOX|nr:related to hexose transporter protein [Fusarium oxysporum]
MAKKGINADKVAETSEVNRLLEQDNTPWYRKTNLRTLYLALIPAALGVEMTTGYDGSVLNGLQAVDRWNEQYNNPTGATLGIISASLAIGTAAGVPIMPYINDHFGRKACVLIGSVVVAIGVVIQTCAINVGMLIASRLIMGLGSPVSLAGAAQLVAELAYPKERSTITGFFQGTWYVGAILAAGVTLGTYNWPNNWSWRLPTLLQILPSLLTLFTIWFIPESPRWLVGQDRDEEALAILIKYHAEGDETSPFVAAEFLQIRETIHKEREAAKRPWKEIVTTSANRYRVFIAICVGFFTQWSGNGLISYYLAKVLSLIGITSRATQNQLNLGLNCWNLVTATISSLLAGFVMRRKQLLSGYVSMTILFACYTACSAIYNESDDQAAAKAVVALIFIYNAAYNLIQPFQYLYIGEIFPFIQRSKGIAVMQLSVRIASAFNLLVNPIGMADLGWKFFLVYVVWLVVETTTVYFFFPETQGLTLEEVALVIEGNKAPVEVINTKASSIAAAEERA